MKRTRYLLLLVAAAWADEGALTDTGLLARLDAIERATLVEAE